MSILLLLLFMRRLLGMPKTAEILVSEAPENKTERVQLLMSPSEVAAIDDWGFKNRIRTRAEAIRRLCQIGLIGSNNAEDLLKSSGDVFELANRFSEKMEQTDDQPSVIVELLHTLYPEAMLAIGKAYRVATLSVEATSGKTFAEALSKIERIAPVLDAEVDKLLHQIDEAKEKFELEFAPISLKTKNPEA